VADRQIVVYGATGYTGRLVAQRLVALGSKPVLAGRSQARLDELASLLGGGLEVRAADARRQNAVMDLVGDGDVLISTVGPFLQYGEPAVRAAIANGCTYLDSTGEPPFIRRIFEEHGPRAARAGAALLTAMGYDFVPGALAAGLALREAGESATRVDVAYFAPGAGPSSASAGTKASIAGVLFEPGFAHRGGHLVPSRAGERTRNFDVHGSRSAAFSIPGAEHFTLPQAYPRLSEVNVFIGGPAQAMAVGGLAASLAGRVPGVRDVLRAGASRVLTLGGTPEPGAGPAGVTTWVVGEAYARDGDPLATVVLEGGDPYSFTGDILAWAARHAAAHGVEGTGALGPVAAFGLDALEDGCREAGMSRR
jgi:short subunit dehydrogenase-like uncharacterized protein